MQRIWHPLWQGWLWFGKRLGKINAAILLTLLYVVVLGIYGPLYRLFVRQASVDSYWHPVHSEPTLEALRRQF